MKHGYTDEEWDDYLTGQSVPEARDRIEAHLVGCLQCWQLYQQEAPTMRALGDAAAEARERLSTSDWRLRSMFTYVMANVRGAEDDSTVPAQIRSGLDFLQSVLEPVFGPKAAQRAMQLAANGSSARSLDRMTRESWNPFLERLAAITSIICGDVFAGLIREHAQLAPARL